MPAKLLLATSQEDCERMKDMLNKKDAAAMVVVMASGNQAASEEKQPAALKTINPVLLALACCGDSVGLDYLLNDNRGDTAAVGAQPPTTTTGQDILGNLAGYCSNTRSSQHAEAACDDVEEGGASLLPALSASSLLEGVTDEGDSALHAVAACGDGEGFLMTSDIIYRKAKHLLFLQNKNGDTPLHCAARARKSGMVSRLIDLAKGSGVAAGVKSLLEMENKLRETALHEAVRVGDEDMVERFMQEDPELAGFPRNGGASPLYLAILLENEAIVDKLYEKSSSGMSLSYSGPNGQNALHAAALRDPVFTERLLKWKKNLSAQKDETGSTPLHFAAALSEQQNSSSSQLQENMRQWRKGYYSAAASLIRLQDHQPRSVCSQLLAANPVALYEADHLGLFPVHVAASVGATRTVALFLHRYPSSAGLRDAHGRTFLHVAVEKKAMGIVDYASRDTSLRWVLNMRDKDGNTAMHLAVQGGGLRMFCLLFGNQQIQLNLTNEDGKTPLDVSRCKIPPRMFYNQNSEAHIRRALTMVGAPSGTSRQDQFEENYDRLTPEEEDKECENIKDTTQNLSIGSVLIATVTFGATFALPGGYKADDHTNGGSPTLAGRYVFEAFMMANTLAFLCSSTATVGFMFSGTPMVNTRSRKFHLLSSLYFIAASVTSLTAAFALGVYMVLAPVAYKTAVAICVLSPFVLLWKNVDYWKRWLLLVGPLRARKGLWWTLQVFAPVMAWSILSELWPLMIIFSWAAFANSKTQ
ncbi:unnamed protein product [Alopecurus aequalis]